MDASIYLNPVNDDLLGYVSANYGNRIAHQTRFHDGAGLPDMDGVKIALVGICDDRNAVGNSGCGHAPDALRRSFYKLYPQWHDFVLADLGDIKTGFSIEDTYFAVNQVFVWLMMQHVIPIFVGGGQDMTYAMYQVYENTGKLVNITTIDPMFDIGEGESLNSQSYLSKIVMHKPNYLFNYTNIGYQSYLVDPENVKLMKDLLFDVYRLGLVKADIESTEPLIRNADFVSLDMGAVRASDAPGNGNHYPNGFNGEEACRMCRYAGLSSKLTAIGFFEYNPLFDPDMLNADLLAQMVWYFVDGVMSRHNDIPNPDSDDFIRNIVHSDEQAEDIVFLYHKPTGKWWIDFLIDDSDKKGSHHYYIPCSEQDYNTAMNNEVPDRWWQFYQKLM